MRFYQVCTLLAAFGTVSNLVSGKRIPSYAGPYIITCRTWTNVSDEYKSTGQIWGKVFFSPPRPQQLQYLWGKINFALPLSDDLKAEVRVSVRSNNQWKRNAFVFNFWNSCRAALRHANFLIGFIYEPEERKRCPMPAIGLREIRNQTVDPVFPYFPMLPYGRYLFTLALIDTKGVTVGLFVIDGNASPKL